MSLQIKQRERQKIIILDLKGRLVLGDEALTLLQRLIFLLDSRRRKVIVNFKGVSSIDESGMETLGFCARRFQDAGGRLVVLNLGPSSMQGADSSKRRFVLEGYQEEADAVRSFFPNSDVARYDILEFVKEQQLLRNRNSEDGRRVPEQ